MANFYGRYSGIFGGSGGGGGGSGGTPYQETPVGAIDNSNTVFTVSTAATSSAAFELFQDGLILVQGTDYTISGTTITMTVAPNFGQSLYAVYTVVGGGGSGVSSLNTLTGAVVLAAGANVTLTPAGNTITIASSGGGGSPLTTKGDLFTYSTLDARLPVGTNGQILSADSTQTTGLKWVTDTAAASYQAVPTGAIDNSNTVFSVPVAASNAASFALYLDGLIIESSLYTIVGTVLTTTGFVANFGQTLYCTYSVVSGVIGVTDINTTGTGSVTIAAGTGISVGTVGSVVTITNTAPAPSILTVQGTKASPQLITAVGGLSFGSTTTLTKKYIAGNGGPIVVTANPQIAAGTSDGQELTIQSVDATNTVELQDGTGLTMNGPWIGGLNSSITFTWDLTLWVEKARQ